MTTVLSSLAIISGMGGLFLPYIVTIFPRLGVYLVYRLRVLTWINFVATLAFALGAYGLDPSTSQFFVLFISLILASLAVFFSPKRIFVALDNPPHTSVNRAKLQSDVLVLGLEHNDKTLAWPYDEMLAPHHLINDRIGNTPLLVAY